MDVTNPGVVNVADQVVDNPDPNGGTVTLGPPNLDDLVEAVLEVPANPDPNGGSVLYGPRPTSPVQVADFCYPPPLNGGVTSSVFATPTEVDVDQLIELLPANVNFPPIPEEVFVNEQDLGQGSMLPVDPGRPADGFNFVGPADFIVVGPAESFQTNAVDEIDTFTIAAVLDADNYPNAATAATTRYYLVIQIPPALSSFPVSMLGRQIEIGGGTPYDGAVRTIQNYGGNFVTVATQDLSPSNGDVPDLNDPAIGAPGTLVGGTFDLDVSRQGSEQVNTQGGTTNVVIAPPPPVDVPFPPQDQAFQEDVNVTTGQQPGTPFIGSGVDVPRASFSSVAKQPPPNLPINVFVT